MKKKALAFTGFLIAAVLIAYTYLLPPKDKPVDISAMTADKSKAAATFDGLEPKAKKSSASGNEQGTAKGTAGGTAGRSAEGSTKGSTKGSTEGSVAPDDTITVPDLTGIVPGGSIRAKVIGITDGDTFKAEWEGKQYKVRLLCIDTPETVKKGVPVQPYGKEASEKLTELLLDKEVTLVFEKGVEDKYGRLLAYAILGDGTCVNAYLVAQGYARMDVVRPNTVHREYFARLQENAIKERKGLWALPGAKRPFVKNDKGYYVPRRVD